MAKAVLLNVLRIQREELYQTYSHNATQTNRVLLTAMAIYECFKAMTVRRYTLVNSLQRK